RVADPLETEVGFKGQFGAAHAGLLLDEIGHRRGDGDVERQPGGFAAGHHGVEVFAGVHGLNRMDVTAGSAGRHLQAACTASRKSWAWAGSAKGWLTVI